MKNILITGFPYVRESFFSTFKRYPEPDDLVFLLPRVWKAKSGKVVFRPPHEPNVFTTPALFYHSHYPIIGGLLKGWMPWFPWHVWQYRHGLKLVYACSEPALLSTLWFGIWTKIFGRKLVLFSWQNLDYKKKWQRLLVILNLKLVDGLICGNRKGLELHKIYFKKPIAEIPMNGVDPEFFKPAPRVSHEVTTFLFVGAIGYRKGIQVILEAFKKISNAKLIIVGSGEYENKLDIHANVTRIPWVNHNDLVKLLQDADVFVYPSISFGGWEEQFGYSMAEASLMELPVISTHTGSIEEVVKDGVTGILVFPDDADALADAMRRLVQDVSLRKKMGEAGRKYTAEHYSHEIIAKKFYDFFTSIS